MTRHDMQVDDCACHGDGHGPTACAARSDVIADIQAQITAGHVLSLADARLAARSGLLSIPAIGRSGFNDGVIYPPEDSTGPNLSALTMGQPSALFAMGRAAAPVTLNCLVLLVDFVDNPGTQSPEHFQTLLFDPANPGSMNAFYQDLSYGKLTVTGTVTGWMRAKHPYGFYTNGESGTGRDFPRNTPGLLEEALTAYCRKGSLAAFDLNGDRYVDGLFLVHAGGGAEAEPNAALRPHRIWSHKWTLPTPFRNGGVRAYAYFTAPEDGRLGVFAHEFGHFLGLPDLYDTSYRSRGVGDWCLMGGGSWNGGGDTPARMSAWCLSELGWIDPVNVTKAGPLSIPALETNRDACYRVWTGGRTSREYFLLENRQQSGRDAALPGSGLAVWHIDETQSDNTNPLAYRVGLVQADGRRDLEYNASPGDPGDLFPGPGNVTGVDDQQPKHPHTRANDGSMTGVALTGIEERNGVITVTVTV